MSNNPFTLTFGKQPNSFIIRHDITNKIIDTFTAGTLSQTYMIEGVRKSGKTVLMTSIANTLKKDKDWIVVNLNSTVDLLNDFAKRLNDECETIPNFFSKGFSISFADLGLGINGNESLRDEVSIIKSILDVVKKKNKKVLITIDEIVHDQNMRAFTSEFQILIREDYPLYLLMTGLYENIDKIQNDPALTFLLRSPKVTLDPLSILQIIQKYKDIFDIDEDKARELAFITKGYAFAFQALGALYWENRSTKTIEDILPLLDGMLDDFVYKKIWSTCSARDKEILIAISKDGTSIKTICEKTGIKNSSFSRYKERLERKGLITSPAYGQISLSLPRFYEVISTYVN
ncbi:MAG: winged helix-turn-helix domain-containing protein [Eubacterium sp.]|nr:winged helix-turn-helix domain-containing protein [Eubacterium sp.]